MNILTSPIQFEWDEGNLEKNPLKHGINNKQTEEAFFNKNLVYPDTAHSIYENRYILFGKTTNDLLLCIIFSLRHTKIRVISSRRASAKERNWYEEQIKKTSKI